MGRYHVYRLNRRGDVVDTLTFATATAAYDKFARLDKNHWTGVYRAQEVTA